MCNNELPSDRWFINSVDRTCTAQFPLICNFWYYCRFSNGADGRRQRRSDSEFFTLGTIGCIFFLPGLCLYYLCKSFQWTFRATYNLFEKCPWYTYILLIILPPLFFSFFLVYYVIFWGAIVGTMVTMWVICYGCCWFSNTPLVRDPNLLSNE